MRCPEPFGEARGESELKFRQAWLLMMVLFPRLSDATAGTRAPLPVLHMDKMSSSLSPEELIEFARQNIPWFWVGMRYQ